MKDLSSGEDTLYLEAYPNPGTRVETSHQTLNFSPVTIGVVHVYYSIGSVIPADVMKQKLSKMPGFQVTWRYSGMEVKSWDFYKNSPRTKAFIRTCSNNTKILPTFTFICTQLIFLDPIGSLDFTL